MKALVLRDIEVEVIDKLRVLARSRGQSLEEMIRDLLRFVVSQPPGTSIEAIIADWHAGFDESMNKQNG